MSTSNHNRTPSIGAALLAVLLTLSSCTLEAMGDPDPSSPGGSGDGQPPSTASQPATTVTTLAGESSAVPNSSSSTTTTSLPPLEAPTFEAVERINTIREFSGYTARGLSRWQRSVDGIEDIRVTSTIDGSEQPALWLAPSGDGDKPLLVILHSWSAPYLQHAGIPFAMFAEENGWAVIAPNFRGVNDDADSTGSELAVQDVIDAIDHAVAQDGVDANRVFAVGYSGGGMMALLLAGRHPDKVTAVAAWGPTYDLIDFYRQSRSAGRHYARDLVRACGGDPRESGPAQEECLRRSPMTYLNTAREEEVPVYIGQGIYDSFVSPSQGARAFNQLADPADRITEDELEVIERRRLPDDLLESIETETFFREGDPDTAFARQSASVWLVYFRADHEMVYQAALRWFASDPR
ncbi:MAG TPA: alpha/beta fold hydrolase [Acidimicrobiia bacterium]|nr:alpha/beta fold hydrolase [Acidimicrobiia bacterium]